MMLVTGYSFCQGQSIIANDKDEVLERAFMFDLHMQRTVPSGDNFIGNGLEFGYGFGSRLAFKVYDDIYVGGALSLDYFDVQDTNVIGEFDRSTKFNAYLFVGYDFRINETWNATADIGYGYSQNKNRQNFDQGSGRFRDSGNVLRFTSSIDYSFNKDISVFVSPSYELVSYNISTADALGDDFDNGNYLSFALGVRYNPSMRNEKSISKSEVAEMQELLKQDSNDLTVKERRRIYFYKRNKERQERRERRNKN
ncbi:hypothetical protein EJ995_09560 [Nonlabens ponticola]|uniref:Outer membrane protein beta-barrel domain-containing protein n=1 Tax=Nonlabens ponticola TaxID=2496866 RepID=A0A3S9MZ97_9FLAO|nr:hypothetical protein EJ995_09560 [Nonlabens ponticola]